MAYIALYRAYRPQKFSEVVGQRHIVKTLQNAIKMNKVAHAYLFCGPRGTGKTTLAKIMAKAMNCENGPTIEPCCECEICKGITQGVVSDVIEIDAASNNGADDIRAIRDTVKFLPSQGKYKVYIIDEVHMLSPQAFNALLKTLEEPPAHVIFILATTEPYRLPNTILSRCQRFDFQTISIEDMLKRLRIVADEEKINITDEALYQIAQSAEGGMRDALSLFDQCISYSVNPEITLDDVLAVSGNISYVKMIDLIGYAFNGDTPKCVELANSMVDEGKEVPRIVNDLILFLRDILMYKSDAFLEKKLMYENANFKSLSNMISKSVIYAWLNILNDALNQMKFSTQKRAYLEIAILKMSDTQANDEAAILSRIESLEKTVDEIYNRPQTIVVQEPKKETKFKTQEEISQMVTSTPSVEKTAQQEEKIEIPDDEININDITNILYDANKQDKENLQKIFNDMAIKYAYRYEIQMLVRGKICAASNDAFIVALKDDGFCNKLMKYETFLKIMEVINDYNPDIKNYVCITQESWDKILADYRSKYSQENPKPKLNEIRLDIKRRIIPEKAQSEDEKLVEETKKLLGENIEILEEE